MAFEDKAGVTELHEPVDGETSPVGEKAAYEDELDMKPGTAHDDADMARLGKKQQLSVCFNAIVCPLLDC